ncbi:MAG: DNA repair protein RecN [Bacteroidales bacterium]|nr:DNA repair protein RecN [Bacteroidales bacterium]
MLKSLTIQNYALIDTLHIDFSEGFSTITGETGAGKSILLGALSLLVGQRADTDVLLDKSRKCVVEAVFDISPYHLESFFEQNEIDYAQQSIIRREILETGRSRAFVNDTPVNLSVLKELGEKLVDIHSQHQNSYLTEWGFQLRVLDIIAGNQPLLQQYRELFRRYHELKKELFELSQMAEKGQQELDYLQHQFNELEQARLKPGEQDELEEEIKVLSNAEEIKQYLNYATSVLNSEERGALLQLKEVTHYLNRIKGLFPKVGSLLERVDAIYIEARDVAEELERLNESVELDPEKLETVRQRVDFLYTLCQKHRVANADELIALYQRLTEKLQNIQSYGDAIERVNAQLQETTQKLSEIAELLSESRKKIVPAFEEEVMQILRQLGMPHAVFSVSFEKLTDFQTTGLDAVTYLFSANKQVPPQDIAKVASGGEISRVMLALKSVIARSLAMPTIIFDEIDTGVSGEIADKMAQIMKTMAGYMQVISITHLPQVAAKGKNQYLVYKADTAKGTHTQIKLLAAEERIIEIARMLSGKEITDAAINNAKVLLQSE